MVPLAVISLVRGIATAVRQSQDLQWSGARIYASGRSPYEVYLNGDIDGEFALSQLPNYAHHLYVLLQQFGLLDFDSAKVLWCSLSLCCGGAAIYTLLNHFPLDRWTGTAICCLFVMSTPFRVTLGNGQFGLVALSCFICLRGSANLNSIAAGLGSAKYSFAPPFFVEECVRRGWRGASLFLLMPTICFLLFCNKVGTNPLRSIIRPLEVARESVGSGAGDLMSVLAGPLGVPDLWAGACGLFLCGLLSLWAVRLADRLQSIALLCLAALLSLKHLSYDYVFLLPLAWMSFSLESRWVRDLTWTYIAWTWFGAKIVDTLNRALLDNSLPSWPCLAITFALGLWVFVAIARLSRGPSRHSPG